MFLYVIRSSDVRMRVKIGVSENPLIRLAQLQTGSASRLDLIHAMRCRSEAHAFDLERRLHAELYQFRAFDAGEEWFSSKALKFLKKQGEKDRKPRIFGGKSEYPACVEFFRGRYRGEPTQVIELMKMALGVAEEAETA